MIQPRVGVALSCRHDPRHENAVRWAMEWSRRSRREVLRYFRRLERAMRRSR